MARTQRPRRSREAATPSARRARITDANRSRGSQMRVLLWHGWLLDGTGSNVYTARVAQELAARGHDVVLLCQERHPDRHSWIDAVATVNADGVSELTPNAATGHAGRCILLRPDIGGLL